MKKRIVCVLLTLILLMSLVPVTASAASMAVSEKGITVLKQIQKYSATCELYGTEWRSGYGTICTKSGDHTTHTIQEVDADKALRAKLQELDTAVNGFVSSTGITLSQSQFDALVLFSYDAGTSWMNGTGVLRSAIINKVSAGELLNAMVSYDDGTNTPGLEESRRIIANMYINGAYSNVPPSNYQKVTYKVKQGEGMLAQGILGSDGYLAYTTYFDRNYAVHQATPTRGGYTFLGWYTSENDGEGKWVPNLNEDCVDATLYAKWQTAGLTYVNAFSTPVVDYAMDVTNLASLNLYDVPDVKAGKATGYQVVTTISVDHDYIGTDGTRWSHGITKEGKEGWVIVKAGSNGIPSGSNLEIDVTVTVTNNYVNSRVNATIHSSTNGSYTKGTELRIINTESADGFLWGQVANADAEPIGWVALMYTNWNSVKDNPSNSGSATNTTAIATAIISCNGFLNVRKDAGTDNAIVGALSNGDLVNIYEIRFVNGHQWGRTDQGWILLTYAKVTMLNNNLDYSNSTDVLAYTFTGTLKNDTIAHTDVSVNSDEVGKTLSAGTLVAVSMVKNDGDGNIWGFNGTGWIKLDDVIMDVAKYVVVADSVTVRDGASSSSNAVEKVVKGVELDIDTIKVVDATIWGFTAKYNGWVNLASKYVTRSNAPIINNAESDKETGLIATVINTGSVRVRDYGATYGNVIGSLAGGTTVKVWESNEDGDWYKIDTNQNGTYDYEGDGWVSAQYLDVYQGTIESESSGSTGSGSSNTTAPVETGLGIVANTYTGVNIRQGAGIGYAAVGKYLNGTSVEILEVTSTATSKWGRTEKGWVCMDYITMISKYPIGGTASDNTNSNAGQNAGGSTTETEGNTTIVRTPAVYAGTARKQIQVLKTADEDALTVRTLNAFDNVTIQELAKVTTKKTITEGSIIDGSGTTDTSTVETRTTYWARTSDGWILDPANSLDLNDLDEITYTVVDVNEVNVRNAANGNTIVTTLDKGTQVTVTTLQIVEDKVWGYVEDIGSNGGWIRLDNLSEGAITVKNETTTPTTPAPTTPTLGDTGNTATGGYVNNAGGYKYTGKVINTSQVNVRASASTGSSVTTTLKSGASLVIYETTISENMAWGRCDAGWVYLYYVDLTPCVNGAVDARVVYNDNTIIYSDVNGSSVAGTYARMSVVDIYEIVGKMARTDKGWVNTDNLL